MTIEQLKANFPFCKPFQGSTGQQYIIIYFFVVVVIRMCAGRTFTEIITITSTVTVSVTPTPTNFPTSGILQ